MTVLILLGSAELTAMLKKWQSNVAHKLESQVFGSNNKYLQQTKIKIPHTYGSHFADSHNARRVFNYDTFCCSFLLKV